jgi:hypothetical protein
LERPVRNRGGLTGANWEFLRNRAGEFSCAVCREPLVPVGVADRFEFAFGCSAGHIVGLESLFAVHREALRTCFELMIATWQRSLAQLTEGAEIARKHGSEDLAKRLSLRVTALEGKIRLFRETFLSGDDCFES